VVSPKMTSSEAALLLLSTARTMIEEQQVTTRPKMVDGPGGIWRIVCVKRIHSKARVGSKPAFSRNFTPPPKSGFKKTHSYAALVRELENGCVTAPKEDVGATLDAMLGGSEPLAEKHAGSGLPPCLIDDVSAQISLCTVAMGVVEDETTHTTVRRLAKAVLKTISPPAVVGTAQLPYWTISGSGDGSTRVLDAEHASLLGRRLGRKWRERASAIISRRGAVGYFVPGDAGGGIVLSRYTAIHMGNSVPVIEIDSLVAANDRRGAGSRLVEYAKELLFCDSTPECEYGFLFAQALNVPWWEVCTLSPPPLTLFLSLSLSLSLSPSLSLSLFH
jgi:predicted pyridoxine 5'-phosphate oxidase superfamily flavin-nucleotide-binding protein